MRHSRAGRLQDSRAYAAFVGRRGPKSPCATCVVWLVLLSLAAALAAVLWLGRGPDSLLRRSRTAADGAATADDDTWAARDLDGQAGIGLPYGPIVPAAAAATAAGALPAAAGGGSSDDDTSADAGANAAVLSDLGWAERGATLARDLSAYVSDRTPAVGGGCSAWVDGGLLMHHLTRGATSLRVHAAAPPLVGVHAACAPAFRRAVADAVAAEAGGGGGGAGLPRQDGCRLRLIENEAAAAPDAGWCIVCNRLVIRAVAYEEHNVTHVALPWPKGYKRCLGCPAGSLHMARTWYEPANVVPCGPWRRQALRGVLREDADDGTGQGLCLNRSAAYVEAWTGDARWRETHVTRHFNHARLASAVHESFRTVALYAAILAGAVVFLGLALVGLVKASEMMPREKTA
eukprot:Rhum_TRINITY_DN12827_c0_g1::Rhum_TRINITY_DN12827_c0_g1_i1::g.54791::m.54791